MSASTRTKRLLACLLASCLSAGCSSGANDRTGNTEAAMHIKEADVSADEHNVLGAALAPCCSDPVTGYFRDGFCRTVDHDVGTHVVCAVVDQAFLEFTRSRGNDLSTPRPEHRFVGLKPGDRWCLCALRWREALEAGVAPPVVLGATSDRALQFVSLASLQAHATP